jgi:hypothetical protein
MKKAAMVFLWAMTLGVGCHCGDDPCDRDGRDERGHRWGGRHDRDRDRDRDDGDEREVCEEDGGVAGSGSDGGVPTGDAGGATTSDAAGAATDARGSASDGGVGADTCVHPAQ